MTLNKRLARRCLVTLTAAALSTAAWAATQHASPYAGQETRAIKSLSASDISALKEGKGWGLAKPAELNGVPGPAHILELKNELDLSQEQERAIKALWSKMNQAAQKYGEQYLQSEADIEQFFAKGHTDTTKLNQLLTASSSSLAQLRNVHLQAHLEAKPLLSRHQNMLYQQLRGYSNGGHGGHEHHSGHKHH